ncbi:MAG: hypothetical protein GY706_14825 [Bacteroides sp.]|nr:hypothetical protein [Bacteroides sp.]
MTLASYTWHPNGNIKQTIEYIDATDNTRRRITDAEGRTTTMGSCKQRYNPP